MFVAMKILVVEDSDKRIEWFLHEFSDHEVTIAKNVLEGKKRVIASKYDLIFLDHDLGEKVFMSSQEENTGYQVAKAIRESINSHTRVVIHSWNLAGANNISSILRHAKCQMFGLFNRSILR